MESQHEAAPQETPSSEAYLSIEPVTATATPPTVTPVAQPVLVKRTWLKPVLAMVMLAALAGAALVPAMSRPVVDPFNGVPSEKTVLLAESREYSLDDELSPEQKSEIIEAVTSQVRRRAYATDVDFNTWPKHLSKYQDQIDRAKTFRQFSRALNEALDEFGISHISIVPPGSGEGRRNAMTGRIGIGYNRANEQGDIRVDNVREGAPADKAGIKTGDVIVAVDGVRPPRDASIRGRVGTPVKLTIKRGGEGPEEEVTVVRGVVSFTNPPKMTKLNDEVALFRLDSFTDGYDRAKVESAFASVVGMPYLIVDLRGNGGGRVDHLAHTLSFLLPRNTVVGTFVSKQTAQEYAKETGKDPSDLAAVAEWADRKLQPRSRHQVPPFAGKVAVLVNASSASASEIFAAAMRELKDAPLVGSRTAGAVLMSNYVTLENGFEMKVPTSDYITVKGHRLEGSPLEPDARAGNPWSAPSGSDPLEDSAVKKAIELLKAKASPAAEEGKQE
jgi:carboxyl-terminal processing protease